MSCIPDLSAIGSQQTPEFVAANIGKGTEQNCPMADDPAIQHWIGMERIILFSKGFCIQARAIEESCHRAGQPGVGYHCF